MLSEDVKQAAESIGAYYLKKNDGDYRAAETDILRLQISAIEVDNTLPNSKVITITTARPGILIGVRGTNIEALEKYLGTTVKIIEDRDPLICYLIPHQPYDDGNRYPKCPPLPDFDDDYLGQNDMPDGYYT